MRHYAGVFVAAVLVCGCGGGGDSPAGTNRTVSCNYAGDVCDTLVATMTNAQQAALQADCSGSGGTFATAACTTTGMVAGSCRYTGTALANVGYAFPDGVLTEYFATGAWTSTTAQAYCESPPPGLWVP